MSVRNRLGVPKRVMHMQVERLRLIGCTLVQISEALCYSKAGVSRILRELGVRKGRGTCSHADVAVKREIV